VGNADICVGTAEGTEVASDVFAAFEAPRAAVVVARTTVGVAISVGALAIATPT
jgi:hypothetical protein